MTIRAAVGLGLDNEPANAVAQALTQAKANLKTTKIDLAVLFAAGADTYADIPKYAAKYTEGIPTIGCSTTALISERGIVKNGVAALLLSFPDDVHFSLGSTREIKTKNSLQAGEDLGEKLLYGFRGVRRNLSLIFSDGLMEDKSNFIYGLQEKLGQSFPLVGASASDNLRFHKTNVYFGHESLDNAACGVLLGGKINFGLGIKHGWKPLGKPRYVTKAADNILYEIDGKPATLIYEEYLAANMQKLRQELKRISVLYPIGIYLPGEEEYLLRNVLRIDDNGALLLHGEIREGNEIRLMIGTKESCLQATRQAAEEVKIGLRNLPPNFILVFDSISRYILLGRQAHKEIEIIKESLGKDVPIVGIYTYGEQAPLKAIGYHGRAYFHNQTVAILAIKGTD